MAIVGPGAQITDEVAPDPMLQGASEYEYVTILNPLTDDFMVQVAQDVPVNVPFEMRKDTSGKTMAVTTDERMASLNYGLNLKNPDHSAKKRIYNSTVIPAGATMNFKGNDAQVVVRQLVSEIMQREGQARFLHDATARKKIEEKIVVSRGSVQEMLDNQLRTPQNQIDEAIKLSNEVQHEEAFAGLTSPNKDAGAETTVAPSSDADGPKRVGRPKKENS